MLIENNSKPFEVPDSGEFIGVIADFVDVGPVAGQFGIKNKVRIVWVLDKYNSEGKPYNAIQQVTASIHEKSALFGIVKSILGTAPSVPFESDVLIGQSRKLFILKETDTTNPAKAFANIKAIMPLPAGVAPLAIPAGFVRAKDKQAKTYNNTKTATAPAATTATSQAAPAAPAEEVKF